MSKDIKSRDNIEQKYKWDIESMYPNEKLWKDDLDESQQLCERFVKLQGRVLENSDTFFEALSTKDKIWQKAEKAFVYARMRKDEDNKNTKYQQMNGDCASVLSKISAQMSFFLPEVMAADENIINEYISSNPKLKAYEFAVKSILKEKAHILTEQEENLLAQMSEVTSATNDIFTILNNADMNFGTVIDENGDEITLTHGNYINFMESKNADVRKNAYENMYNAYKSLINTLATTYNYNTKTDVVTSRIRKYDSCLSASLSSENIDTQVYHNLLKTVNEYLPALHKYTSIRKKVLGVNELKMHDMYVPLVNVPKETYSYENSVELMMKGLAPLGDEYLQIVSEAISARWIDVCETEGKTSGAYSFGSYDSLPFILLNHAGSLKDAFTLVHEMGHSMHSYYTRSSQPYTYGGHSIFTAEVASTVNECLLMQHLLESETDNEMKKYILNMHIDSFRSTLFRQAMFAEFELMTHEKAEAGETLTAEFLSTEYGKLNKKYFGESLTDDDLIQYEWARIPHFYRAFYVYQYSTGYSAANAITTKILNEGEGAVKAYKDFLKTGNSDYPVNLLRIAGVDMSKPQPVELAMKKFKGLVDEFEKLV